MMNGERGNLKMMSLDTGGMGGFESMMGGGWGINRMRYSFEIWNKKSYGVWCCLGMICSELGLMYLN